MRVIDDTIPYLPGKIKSRAVLLKLFDNAKALSVMREFGIVADLKSRLSRVAERSMSEIVAESRRFGKILVEPERSCDYPCDLRYLKRVGKSRSVVFPCGT